MRSFKDLKVFKEDKEINHREVIYYLNRMLKSYEYAQEQAQLMEENNISNSKHYWLGVARGCLTCIRLIQRALLEDGEEVI